MTLSEESQSWLDLVSGVKPERKRGKENSVEAQTPLDIARWISDFTNNVMAEISRTSIENSLQLIMAYTFVYQKLNEAYRNTHKSPESGADENAIKLSSELDVIVGRLADKSRIKFKPGQFNLYPALQEGEEKSEEYRIADAYVHDLGNLVQVLNGFAETVAFGVPYSDVSQILQSSFSSILEMQKAFDLNEFKITTSPISLELFRAYLVKLKGVYKSAEKLAAADDLRVEIELYFDSSDDLDNLTINFNIPTLLRVVSNLEQNAKRAYQIRLQENPSAHINPVLKIRIAIQDSTLYIVCDDQGPGFPSSKGKQALTTSIIDGTTLESYMPETGKTSWNSRIKGTGTGLAAIRQTLTEAGITVAMGTRIDEHGTKTGARTEFIVPITSKPSSQQ